MAVRGVFCWRVADITGGRLPVIDRCLPLPIVLLGVPGRLIGQLWFASRVGAC